MTIAKNNPEIAKVQFKEDLDFVLNHPYKEHFDWKIESNIEELDMKMTIWSFDENHKKLDDYYVKMDLSYYRTYPPGVIFVNPETNVFDEKEDLKWLPKIVNKPPGVDIKLHPTYNFQNGVSKQLVCNSMTLEYYLSNHSPTEDQKWDETKHNLFATINMLQMALKEPYYGGRTG